MLATQVRQKDSVLYFVHKKLARIAGVETGKPNTHAKAAS